MISGRQRGGYFLSRATDAIHEIIGSGFHIALGIEGEDTGLFGTYESTFFHVFHAPYMHEQIPAGGGLLRGLSRDETEVPLVSQGSFPPPETSDAKVSM
jgi:hypothetical protein